MRKKPQEQRSRPEIVYISEKRPGGSRRRVILVGAVATGGIVAIVIVAMLLKVVPASGWVIAGGVAVSFTVPGLIAGYRWWLAMQHDKTLQSGIVREQNASMGLLEAKADEARGKARQAHATADNLEIDRHIHSTAGGTLLLGLPSGINKEFIPSTLTERQGLALSAPEDLPKLIDVLRRQTCVAIEGGRDAGKTVAALWWASFRDDGDLLIADPKGFGINPWPSNAFVASDDTSIVNMVRRVAAELKRRREHELFNEPPVYLLIDELQWLVEENEERPGLPIMKLFFMLITFGREFGVHASFTTGDGGVESLKIKGKSGLKRGLVWIEINLNPITQERKGYIKHKPGQVFEVELPGVFAGRNQAKRYVAQRPLRVEAKSPEEIEAEQTAEWIAAVKNGEQKGVACVRIFGRAYSGNFAQKLKKALENR